MIQWAGGMRWSYSAKAWLGLCASMSDGRVLVRHELTWKETAPEQAVADLALALGLAKIPRLVYLAGNVEMFPTGQESGPTDSETFSRAGFPMRRGTKDRINGWSRLRAWLQPRKQADGKIAPSLIIHPACKVLLRTLPILVSDATEPDDIAETTDAYPAEGLMLFCMARPLPWQEVKVEKEPDPLSGAFLWRELREGSDPSRVLGDNRRRDTL